VFHKVVLIGNLGQDPEMRYTPSGTAVTNFSVATTSRIGKQTNPECPDGWKESYNGSSWELTTWWRVTCWRGLAETVNQYVSKGMQVFVEGRVNGEAMDGNLNPRVWQGQDGVHRASFELTAQSVRFLGGRGEAAAGPPIGEPPPEGFEEDALPF